MSLKNIDIIFGITGSLSACPQILNELKNLKEIGANIYPIMSYYAFKFNKSYIQKIEYITNNKIIYKMNDAELLGNNKKIDIMIILPTSGNTIAKLANSISDTSVTLTAKTHLRYKKPLVLSINAIDGLSTNASNIGLLLNRKNIYFVPFSQPNPITRPYTLSSNNTYLLKTIECAMTKEQLEPILL